MPNYYVDLKQFFWIWFSKDPENYLGIENALRLIRIRHLHPDAKLTLVYSSQSLNDVALKELQAFSERHKIILIDFDNDLPPLLTNEQDKALYETAKQEIAHARNNKGGNMAAASDCVRNLIPVLKKCSNYADCDVKFNFSKKRSQLKVKAPITLTVAIENDVLNISMPSFNNDFMLVARSPRDPENISTEAIERLRFVQKEMLSRYANVGEALFRHPIKGFPSDLNVYPDYAAVIRRYFQQNPQSDIFALRQFIQKIDIVQYFEAMPEEPRTLILQQEQIGKLTSDQLKIAFAKYIIQQSTGKVLTAQEQVRLSSHCIELAEEMLVRMRHRLYTLSVTWISGPINYFALYQDVLPDYPILTEEGLMINEWNKYVKCLQSAALAANNLGRYLSSITSLIAAASPIMDEQQEKDAFEFTGTLGDQSWSDKGMQKKLERENKLNQAAITLQYAWKNWKKAKNTKEDNAPLVANRKAAKRCI